MELSDFDYQINPKTDGYDHIRIHPLAATILGRLLCHAARTPFTHPVHGHFASMEAYWQWVRSGLQHECLRETYGHKAVSLGMRYDTVPNPEFHEMILEGVACKIHQTPRILDLIVLSTIPFLRYTQCDDMDDYELDYSVEWCINALTNIRAELINSNPQIRRFEFKMPQILEESLAGSFKPLLNA